MTVIVSEAYLPTMEDFLMDPASAVADISGAYPEGIEKEEIFRKILEEMLLLPIFSDFKLLWL